jgi:molecular chaperone GrpE
MMKKETNGVHKENPEENLSGTDEKTGPVATGENEKDDTSGEEIKTITGEEAESRTGKEEKSVAGETKRKKHSKEKELESKLKEQHDKYLRLSAEFDNYRKRMLKERIELTQYLTSEFITRILPVMDDFDRAMDSMKSAQEMDAVRQGIELIYNKFKDYLSQQGVKEIEALHKEFNTDYHDAVSKFPVEDDDLKGKVIEVVHKGYILNDRVIRYSKVVVGE